jgi:hypothetical protein
VKTSAGCAAVCLLLVSALASAQPFGPSGSAFRVNTSSGYEIQPAIGMDATGSFVIAWKSGFHDLLAQRYAKSGTPLGGEFRVNSSASSYPYEASVSGASTGLFTIAWTSSLLNEKPGIAARRFASGVPLGDEFRVNTTTGFYDQKPSIASDAGGNFVVVWGRNSANGGSFPDLFGQRFASSGAFLGSEFRVNTSTTNSNASAPVGVARAGTGAFVVAWTPTQFPAAVDQVFVRTFDASGAPASLLNPSTQFSGGGTYPSAAYDSAGDFVVVWGGAYVWAQRYDSTGAPRGGNVRVDVGPQIPPNATKVGSDAAGDFVVVWGRGYVGSTYLLLARRFSSTGAPLGDPFRVDASTSVHPRLGGLSMDAAGNFVVTWQEGIYPTAAVYARRYCASLAGDANASGALEVGDVFYLINSLFAGGPAPMKGSDVNGDGKVDILDVFYLINALFAGGPGPACA